ncbi:SOS response-associated peptidase family protein [Planctobacterium marinum]|uniref:SOS response-associated peptidase family protein n=1 Tax=Planctobacterium marinum TaxID=1631968 RepID=UPI001E36D17D|nr:SOS response-associated peptidase family protein [Planctobacterium marinum]MCC2607664.1 SOS response-associated peptidase [Planctobacterium marinum]
MCGRLNVTDAPGVRALCDAMDIELGYEPQIFQRYIGAANKVSVVRQKNGRRIMENALWWLLLEATETGFKPSRYTSINTRYDSLNNPRKAGYRPFRQSRILIPVTGFGESEYQKGKLLHCHDMQAKDGALLMAGLCKEWTHSGTGESITSCSVITLPPHPKLQNIHSKSTPMMFPQDSALIDAWLDEDNQQVEQFEPLLQPCIYQDLVVQQIAKPSQYQQTLGEPFSLAAD